MNFAKTRYRWFINLFLVVLLGATALSFGAKISPLTFGNDATDDATWLRLVQYKLWATGGDGITIYGQAHITDTTGYVGSARGGLTYHNTMHALGGPLIFAGPLKVYDGQDTIVNGPSRFSSMQYHNQSNWPGKQNVFNGKFCLTNGGSCPNAGSSMTCTCDGVPEVDRDLKLPTVVPNFKYDLTLNGFFYDSKIYYIDVPRGEGAYNIVINGNITLQNEAHIIVRMPPEGRSTRIVVNGQMKLSSLSHIQVMYADESDRFRDNHWAKEGINNAASIKEYAGDLLFYLRDGMVNESLNPGVIIQGTYIIPGTINIKQHFSFAGQILADKIIIEQKFKSEFRYVPFEGPKVDTKAIATGALYEGHSQDEIKFSLTEPAAVQVSFKYCYAFENNANENTLKSNKEGVITPAHRKDIASDIPECKNGKFYTAHFKEGQQFADKNEKVTAFDDDLTENLEYFYLYIYDVDGAVLDNGKRSDSIKINIYDNDDKAMGRDTIIEAIILNNKDSIGYEDIQFAIKQFPAFSSSDGKTAGARLNEYQVKIVSLPMKGILKIRGNHAKVGDVIGSEDLKRSELTFVSALNDYGDPDNKWAYDSFEFLILNKNGVEAPDAKKVSLQMLPVNDAPVITSIGPANSYTGEYSIDRNTFRFNEDFAKGVVIGVTHATDVDALRDPNATLTYKFGSITSEEGYADASKAFTINPATGEISVNDELSYNKKSQKYKGVVVVTDNGVQIDRNNVLSDTMEFYIELIEVPHKPEIIKEPNRDTILVYEHSKDSTIIMEYLAIDENIGDALQLSYKFKSLVGGIVSNEPVPFTIDSVGPDKAVIRIKGDIDYETMPNTYHLRVIVSDNKDDAIALKDSADLNIYIVDINEVPIVNGTYAFQANDYDKYPNVLGKIEASDLDIKASPTTILTYSMSKIVDVTDNNKDVSDLFGVNPTTGEVYVKSVNELGTGLQNHRFEGKVKVTDNGGIQDFCHYKGNEKICEKGSNLFDSTIISITIPEFNYPPKFDKDEYEFSVKENSIGGTIVGRVSATDQNVGTVLSFSITESSLPFEIVSADLNSADIKLKKNAKIDFETKNQYKFKVYVTDGGKNNSAEVTINVEDVNEQPVISGANFEINENAPIGTPVGVVKVKDEDTWTIMSYALSDSTKDAAKLFKITPMVTCDAGYYCGQITVNTNNLNFEAEKKYIIKVTATDNGETYGLPPSLSATAAFSINVKDVNEPPEFEQDNYHFYVHENATEFTDIGIVHATDVDNGDKITYSINGSASINTFFELNEETGLIQLMAPLDYESEQEYKFKVIATDKGLLTDEVEVTISVIDVNEDPIFIESQVLKVTEWVPIGTKVGVVKSDDMDILNPDFRKHKYYVVGGDSSLFKIDSLTGEIIVKDTINDKSDKLAGYSLHILVVDYSREDSLLYADGDVFIELKQANNPPFLKPATFYVLENSLAGTFVGEVIAEDDFTSDEDLVYSMVTPSNEFEFSTTLNGQLVVKEGAVLDYETQKQYFITVRVTDGDGAYSEKEYRVVVRNENEPPELDNTEFSIAENSPAGTLVGKVTGIDSEDFPNQLKFAFDSNFVSNEFELSSSGTIRVKEGAVLDYETQQIYTLIVTVTDKEFATTTGEVTIYITNVNDLPVFGKNEFHIPENSPENTVVGYLEAHDEEDASEDLIYSLVGSSLEFEVTRDGKITVKKGAQLDYETKPEYAIKVSVKDLDGDSTIGTAKIFLDDVREPPTLADTTLHIPENIPIGSKVGVLISDNPEKDAVKFELITTTDKFKIRDNGTILTTGNIDYESQKEYKLKVVVIGDDGSLDTAIVTIVVDNIIEQPEVEITRAQDEDTIWVKPDTIYTNKKKIELEWTVNKRFQPDTLASFPDNGTYVFALCYEDASMDLPGCDTVVVKVDNSIPKVKISKSAEDTTNITGVTIVEQVAEDDTVFYVNHEDNVVHIRITDKAMDVDSTFNVSLRLDSLSNTKKALEKIKKLSEKEITLDDAEKAQTKRIAIDENTYEVTFKRLIGDDTVTVLYYTDKKGKAIKNSDGDVIMKVMNNVEINGKPAKVSYNVNGKTGEIIKNSNGGVYGFSYSYVDDFGGVVGINYSVDEKGKFAKTKVGDLGYQVTYTYKNRYGNTATKDIIVVVDKIVPVVKILSPADGLIVTTTGIDVKWTVDGEVQDTLVIQGLKKGINKIIRTYRDKAGNEASDSVTVYLKNPKELVVHVEKPVTIVDDDSVRKYYDVNPPREGQSYAVNMYNPYKGEEVETLIGGSFGKDKGSKKEPYPGMKGHLGPTLIFDALAPRCGDKTASGLCTLDDIIERDGLVSLETGGGWDRKKVTIDNYMKNYCTDDVFKDYSRYGAAKTNLYNTKLHVTIWVYTNLGGFLNKYSFVQEVNDPDFVSTVGEVNMSFEMKPNMDGNVITEDGRLLGTGAYIFSTEVKSVSELRCKLPDEERGNKRYVTEDLRKSFGYKRPITNKKK